MNNRRKLVIALGAGALVAPLASFGQQQAKIFRIGFLHPSSATLSTSRVVALRSGLRDYGYVEGKNLAIEFRWADGNYERLPELAAELVRVNVDVIVTSGTPSTRAAKEATTTLPIVMTVTGDAVGSGLIASLARPGGNLTGATYFDPELTGKRFELLKEAVPRIAHLAAFVNPLNPQAMGTALQALQVVTKVKKVALEVFEARGPNEFDNAFSAMAKKRVDAVANLSVKCVVHHEHMFDKNRHTLLRKTGTSSGIVPF